MSAELRRPLRRICRGACATIALILGLDAAPAVLALGLVEVPVQRWALIIGREDGQASRQVQDLQHLATLLKQHYGYVADKVIELYDEKASVENIRNALLSILGKVGRSDTLFVYLSLPTIGAGDEIYLVTHGGSEKEPWTLLPAFELQKLVSGLQARSALAVIPLCAMAPQSESPFVQQYSYSRGADRVLSWIRFCPLSRDPVGGRRAFAKTLLEALEPGRLASGLVTVRNLSLFLQNAEGPFEVATFQFPANSPTEFSFTRQRGRLDPLLKSLTVATAPADQEAAIGSLVAAVRQEPPETRHTMIEEIGRALLDVAANAQGDVRLRAIAALGEIAYGPAVEDLGQFSTNSQDATLRKVALDALVRVGGDSTLPHLRRALRDSDASVRTAAIRALAARKHEESFPELLALVDDPEESVKVAALQAVATFPARGDEVQAAAEKMLADTQPTVRREAASVLGGLPARGASKVLLDHLRSDLDVNVRQAVAYSIGRSFKEADRDVVEQALLQAARPASPAVVREAAVWALGNVRGPVAERQLRAALQDSDPRVKRTAAEKLGELESAAAVTDLTRLALDTKSEPEVRQAAIAALGAVGDPRATEPLLAALADENPYVRGEAEKSLARLKDPPATRLAAKLRDRSPRVRAEAAQRLGEVGDPAAAPGLLAALTDEDESVRQAAISSLARYKDPASIERIVAALQNSSVQTRQGAIAVLGLMGKPEVTSNLLPLLKDPTAAVRAEVVRSLGKLGRSELVLEKTKDADPSVRLAVAETLASVPLKSGPQIEALQTLANDRVSDVRWTAILALGNPIK